MNRIKLGSFAAGLGVGVAAFLVGWIIHSTTAPVRFVIVQYNAPPPILDGDLDLFKDDPVRGVKVQTFMAHAAKACGVRRWQLAETFENPDEQRMWAEYELRMPSSDVSSTQLDCLKRLRRAPYIQVFEQDQS